MNQVITKYFAIIVGLVAITLVLVPGCSSLSKVDCLYGDWYEIGLEDGQSGIESERFNNYVDTCARYGVRPDFTEYSKGRTKGLESFCTRTKGYSEGRKGRSYQYVCSGTAETLFLEAHSIGFDVHIAEQQIHTVDQAVAQRNTQIERLENQIDTIEDKLVDEDTDAQDRKALVKELDRVHRDISDAQTQIILLREQKIDAIIDYREAVDQANENGFRELQQY